jgi:glycosyltransferase 2 family protein
MYKRPDRHPRWFIVRQPSLAGSIANAGLSRGLGRVRNSLMKTTSQIRGILRIVATILTILILVVLIQSIRRDGPAAVDAWRSAHVRWTWVALSVLFGAIGHAFYIIGWRRLLNDAGIRVPLWQLIRFFLVSNLGRYLPGGKAWQMGIIGVMSAEHDLPAAAITASSLFQGIVGVGVGAIVLFAAGGALVGLPIPWLALPLMGVTILLLCPAIIKSSARLRQLITRHWPDVTSVTIGTMWMLIWTSVCNWIMWGAAFYALGGALLPSPIASLSSYIAAWSGSFLAGLIAVVSPAGLGAREGVMQAILHNAGMNAADVLIVVVIARVWSTILDVVPAVTVLVFRKRRHAQDAVNRLAQGAET